MNRTRKGRRWVWLALAVVVGLCLVAVVDWLIAVRGADLQGQWRLVRWKWGDNEEDLSDTQITLSLQEAFEGGGIAGLKRTGAASIESWVEYQVEDGSLHVLTALGPLLSTAAEHGRCADATSTISCVLG